MNFKNAAEESFCHVVLNNLRNGSYIAPQQTQTYRTLKRNRKYFNIEINDAKVSVGRLIMFQ